MRLYLYSIFVRFFLAFSGFLVFLLTAYLYGADGRGVIGYGTSLFAVAGIIFSGNLGRAYISRTKQNELQKREQLEGFLFLNLVLSLLASIGGLLYWWFSKTAQGMLSPVQVCFLALTAFFHVWSVNGNAFYAAFVATKRQENVILVTRIGMILFLVALYLGKPPITIFIAGYSLILLIGALAEIILLGKWYGIKASSRIGEPLKSVFGILKASSFHHLDHLVFYIYPLVLTVLSASYLSKSDVGKFNFALQVINLIFLFSTTANIRLTAYVSDVGFRARIVQFKKLFWATLAVSCVSVLFISLGLAFVTSHRFGFRQFEGVSNLFLVCSISVPGYILYQFFTPIWVELRKEKPVAIIHCLNFALWMALVPWALSGYGLYGLTSIFSFFYCGLVLTQILLYRKYIA